MPYIILDRDGVINYESNQYIKTPDEWQAIPGSLEAIAQLNQAGFEVLIATNQSGISRGLYDESILSRIHAKLTQALAEHGGHIKHIFFCPHHPEENCGCRKPKTGLFEQMRMHYPISFAETYFIGDSLTDEQAAQAIGCPFLLVLTGNGKKTLKHISSPHFENLAKAVAFILD